jgi:hypothetical protein
MANIL